MPQNLVSYPGENLLEPKVLDPERLLALVENDVAFEVNTIVARRRSGILGYQAEVADLEDRRLWISTIKPTADQATNDAVGEIRLRRWLYRRRIDGMSDPAVQIAYGIEERRRDKKDL